VQRILEYYQEAEIDSQLEIFLRVGLGKFSNSKGKKLRENKIGYFPHFPESKNHNGEKFSEQFCRARRLEACPR
jgi:hypothetical protein